MDYLSNVERKGGNVNSFSAFLLFLCMMLMPGWVWAQEKAVTLDVRQVSLESALKQIEKQTGLTFFYDQTVVDAAPAVTLRVSNASPEAALDEIARQTGLSFNRDNNTITVGKISENEKNKNLKTISGKVIDENGEPLIGVNVLLKGTSNGVITDVDGKYTLRDVPVDGVIVFSYIGYQSQELKADSKHLSRIVLGEDTQVLDELVVVGYGVQSQKLVTTSISKVKMDDIDQGNDFNPIKMLQGRVSGVSISNASGQPGEAPNVTVRGIGSISGGSSPLYVVDGIPSEKYPNLNPNDIESMEVLKDASAAAIYGSRANSGVIIITTKSGKSGKTNIDFSARYGFMKLAKDIEMANSEYDAGRH